MSEVASATLYGADSTSSAYLPRALGDLRGDGLPDFAVGNVGADGDATGSGTATVFNGGGF